MKQRKLFTALIVTASAIAGGSLAYASKEAPPNDAVALFSKAKVTLIQAIAAAEQHAGGKAVQVELEQQSSGGPVYDVEVVTADHKVYDVKVDAASAKVLSSKLDKADGEDDDD
jgi:uncharacterized membrane protein YkoI